MSSEPAAEGGVDPGEVKGQEMSPGAATGPADTPQSEATDTPAGDPKPKKKPWSLRNLGLVQRITRKKPQADDNTSEGQRTPPKNPSLKESTPQPEDISPAAVGSRPDPEEKDSPPVIAEDPFDQPEDPSSSSALTEDVTSGTEDVTSATKDLTLATEGTVSAPPDQPEQPAENPSLEDQSASESEATTLPSEDTTSPDPAPSLKELSPVPEEPASPEAAAADQTSAPSGSEAAVEEPASSPDPAPQPVVPDASAESSEVPQPEEVVPIEPKNQPPVPIAPEQATSPSAEEVPEETSDQVDSKKHLPIAELPLTGLVRSRTPSPTPVEEQISSPTEAEIPTPPPTPVSGQTPPPSPEEPGTSPAEGRRTDGHTTVKKMAASLSQVMASPAVALTAEDEANQSAVELPPQPTNQQTDISQLNQLSLQGLCRDMKQSFKQNSLGLQNRLSRLDDRMSAVERMQFLIRKQSEEMQDLKWKMAEAERRSKEDQKKVNIYRRKMKDLQNSLQEMQVRESVRVRAEKELERREADRRQQQQQQQQQQPSSHIITLTQPMPIFLPSSGYNQDQSAYNGRRDSGYYQPMPPPQQTYQQPALPPPPPPPPASVVELPPERAQSPPPPPPPPSQPAASRRGSMFSVKSFKSTRKGVAAQ